MQLIEINDEQPTGLLNISSFDKKQIIHLHHLINQNHLEIPYFRHNTNPLHINQMVEQINQLENSKEAILQGLWKNKQLIGIVYLYNIDLFNHSSSIFLFIHQDESKSTQIISEVAKLIQTYMDNFNLKRIQYSLPMDNDFEDNLSLLNKIGFSKEGISKKSYKKDSIYFDCIQLSVIKNIKKSQLIIKELKLSDKKQVQEFVQKVNQYYPGSAYPLTEETLKDQSYYFFKVMLNENWIGTTGIKMITPKLCETIKTIVFSEFRGLGYGKTLSRLIEEKCKELGLRKIRTTIFSDNYQMIMIKLKQGYIIEGFHSDHEKPGFHEYSLGKVIA